MVCKLLGRKPVNFTNNEGDLIDGTSIYVAYKDEDVEGLCCEKFFVKGNKILPKDININDTLNLSFNHKGKIEGITKA